MSVTLPCDIGEFMQMPLDQLAELLLPISRGDFSAHHAGADADRISPVGI